MEGIRCIHCEKIRHDFVGRTFALFALIHILHRVSCTNEMVQSASTHYETHQNMCLGSDGVDRVDLLDKILMRLYGLNFCINYNSSKWSGLGAFIVKTSDVTLWHELLH